MKTEAKRTGKYFNDIVFLSLWSDKRKQTPSIDEFNFSTTLPFSLSFFFLRVRGYSDVLNCLEWCKARTGQCLDVWMRQLAFVIQTIGLKKRPSRRDVSSENYEKNICHHTHRFCFRHWCFFVAAATNKIYGIKTFRNSFAVHRFAFSE